MDEGRDGGAEEEHGGGHADEGLALAGPAGRYRLAQVVQRAVARLDLLDRLVEQSAQGQLVGVEPFGGVHVGPVVVGALSSGSWSYGAWSYGSYGVPALDVLGVPGGLRVLGVPVEARPVRALFVGEVVHSSVPSM